MDKKKNEKNEEQLHNLLLQMQKDKLLSKKTVALYKSALRHYTQHFNQTINELLQEAYIEKNKAWYDTKTYKKLVDYRSYYYFSNLKWIIVIKYLRLVKATYRYKYIPIYDLPQISTVHANKNKPMTIKQLLTKKELRKCIELSDITLSAIIVFGKDTGLSLSDILSLKLKDFIEDSYEFHNQKFTKNDKLGKNTVNCEYYTDFVIEVCNILQETLNEKYQITGTIYPRRKKTGKEHFCFYSYESLKFIVSMLLERTSKIKEYDHKYTRGCYDENYIKRQLYPDSQLFKMNVSVATKKFHRINETLKLGNVGDSGRFSSHKLRKFNANMLRRGGFSR